MNKSYLQTYSKGQGIMENIQRLIFIFQEKLWQICILDSTYFTSSQLCWSLLRCNWSRSFMWSLKGWGRQWLTLLSFLARETLSSWKFPLCTEHWPLGNGMVQGKTEATLPSLCLFLFPRVLFYCAPEVFKVNSCNHPELFLLADHCLMIDLCRGTLIFVGQSPTLSSQHRFLIFLL